MGQTWVKSDFGTVCGQKEIPKNGGVKPFLGIYLVAGEGLENGATRFTLCYVVLYRVISSFFSVLVLHNTG